MGLLTEYNILAILAFIVIIGLLGSIAAIQGMDKYERDLLTQDKKDLTDELNNLIVEFKQTHQTDYFYIQCVNNWLNSYYSSFDTCMNDNFPSFVSEIDRINNELSTKQALINDLA